jgi:hypothetical protein
MSIERIICYKMGPTLSLLLTYQTSEAMARKGRERGRVKIQWIVLRRRLPGRKLAARCDTSACLVVYCPGEARPVVCSSPEAASEVLRRYRDVPALERFKSKLDGAMDFLKQENEKLRMELAEVQRQRRDAEIDLALLELVSGRRKSLDDLPSEFIVPLACKVQNKLQEVQLRLQELRLGATPAPREPPPHVPEDGCATTSTSSECVSSSSTSE